MFLLGSGENCCDLFISGSQPFWLYVILGHNLRSVNTWVLYMLCRNKLQRDLSLLLEWIFYMLWISKKQIVCCKNLVVQPWKGMEKESKFSTKLFKEFCVSLKCVLVNMSWHISSNQIINEWKTWKCQFIPFRSTSGFFFPFPSYIRFFPWANEFV